MTDRIDVRRRSRNMAAIKSKNMKPELTVRKIAHRLGYRFRLHRIDLPGKPDLVFGPKRKVVFVHGCFWHLHPDSGCKDARLPKSNTDYWRPKLQRNVERDSENLQQLQNTGWDVLVLWECETKLPSLVESKLSEFLG